MRSIRRRAEDWLIAKGLRPHRSYSQCGEDLIVKFLFRTQGIAQPSYIDIGAHDPNYLNNTKLFYDGGSRGINIEANPALMARFRRKRARDVNLNVGIVDDRDDGKLLDFHVASVPTMSTFSAEEAKRLEEQTSVRIQSVIQVPARGLTSIVKEHWNGTFPDLLTIDIEGLDGVVIPSLLQCAPAQRPKALCMETLTYAEKSSGGEGPEKKHDLIAAVRGAGYEIYADTNINTIFCRSDLRTGR